MSESLCTLSAKELWEKICAPELRYVDDISELTTFDAIVTYFFRNHYLLENVMRYAMTNISSDPLRVLCVGGNIGCEALTVSMIADHIDPSRNIEIHSLDIEELLTAFARKFQYPDNVLEDIPKEYSAYFNTCTEQGWCEPIEKIKSRVTYLPACDILEFNADKPYDVVFALNLAFHLNPKDLQLFTKKLSSLSQHVLGLNSFEASQSYDEDYEEMNDQLFDDGFRMVNEQFKPLTPARGFPRRDEHRSAEFSRAKNPYDWDFRTSESPDFILVKALD